MNIFELKNKVAAAKAAQAANTPNANIRYFAGQQIIITGMKVTSGIMVPGIGQPLSKVTFSILKGHELIDEYDNPVHALDSFHEAAVAHAEDLIEALGEFFPAPMVCEIVEKPTHQGTKSTYYVELLDLFDDPSNPISLQEAAAASEPMDNPINTETPSEQQPQE